MGETPYAVCAGEFGPSARSNSKGLYRIMQGQAFTQANWVEVSSFGTPGGADPVPLVLFNGRVYGVYYPEGSGTFEIWHSPDYGKTAMTWTRVVASGFGAPQNHYLGTKSHYGAEVWRYNGLGKSGWTNVTPSWAGVSVLMPSPGRNTAMAVYGNELYLAEGFPTGNLARYNGPHPLPRPGAPP